ncbi:glycosyltransferase family 61 protein [Paenibacillus hemerocallicola]|nr:glycosyltransferase family 61 protein [Paenibacillus hemerocallicola]
MREAIPDGIYESLWSWVETSRSRKYPDHELQGVLYPEETVSLTKAAGPDAQDHPNFRSKSVGIPKAFVGVLPEGRYWVAEDRTIAVIAPDNKLIWDVSMQYHFPNAAHPVFQHADLPQADYTAETVAVLSYAWESNYYHWLGDVLARIHLLDLSGIPIDKYLINGNDSAAFQTETLSMLGIPGHKIMQSRRGMHLKAKRLVVPSLEMLQLLPLTPHSMAKWAIQYLRSELMNSVHSRLIEGYERIYVSRGDAAHRVVTNEDRITEMVESCGFKIIVPGHMPVADQIRTFASADIIVAPHGAGLTNLMFCQSGTRVLELFSPNYVNPLYWYMSNIVQLDYCYFIGQGERQQISSGIGDIGYRMEPITVDLEAFSGMLKLLGVQE